MLAVLTKYGPLGVKHLSRLCGYCTDKQWEFLQGIGSISKSFAFIERLVDSMKVVQMYKFLRSVINSDEHKHMNEQYLKKTVVRGQ